MNHLFILSISITSPNSLLQNDIFHSHISLRSPTHSTTDQISQMSAPWPSAEYIWYFLTFFLLRALTWSINVDEKDQDLDFRWCLAINKGHLQKNMINPKCNKVNIFCCFLFFFPACANVLLRFCFRFGIRWAGSAQLRVT